MDKIKFTDALRNHLLNRVDSEAQEEGMKKNGKPMLRYQYTVILSAIAAIDFLNSQNDEANQSCIPPDIAIATFRGQPIPRKEIPAES